MTDLSAHHVGLTVTDLETVLPFYRDVLGFPVVDRFTVSGEAFADAVGVDGATGSFAHLDAEGVRLELVEYDPAGEDRSPERLNEAGATHVGLAVDDLESFHAELPADVDAISEPRTTSSGTSILFVRDPEANLVEIIEA